MISMDDVEGFASFFQGRVDAYGNVDGGCVRKPVTINQYKQHLEGKESLGIYPLMDDHCVLFSAIDIDIQNLEIPLNIRKILLELNVPSYIARSKSKGFHLYSFYFDRVPAPKVRELYRRVQNKLGIEHEIFPKQDMLPSGGLGNYINLPLFGATRPFLGFDLEGKPRPVTLPAFLDKVRVVSEDHVDRALQELPPVAIHQVSSNWVVDLLSRPIPTGQRDISITRAAGYFHKKDLPKDITLAILNNLQIEHDGHPFTSSEIAKCVTSVYKYPEIDHKALEPVSLATLLEEQDNEPQYLVSSILPMGGVCILGGEPGAGKTWVVLTLARDVASGKPFLGKFPTELGAVLIIDEESGRNRLRKRMLLLGATKNLPVFFSIMQMVNLSDADWEVPLRQSLETIKPRLVIMDSLIRMHRGDENDAGEMAKFFASLTKLRQEFSCAFLITHHLRKRTQATRLNNISERLRGSSDISAYADTVIGIDRVEDRLVLSQLKNRDGELFKPLALAIDDLGNNKTEITVLEEVDVEADKRKQAREIIRKALEEKPLFREDILVMVKADDISERTCNEALKSLLEVGEIVKSPEGHKVRYSLK